jgi:hypothetical protein
VTTVITIRDVPDEVKEALARDARERGQSLQAFLLGVLGRQAAFQRNRQVLADIERDLAAGGGAGGEAPDAKDVIEAARVRADRAGDAPGSLAPADDRR